MRTVLKQPRVQQARLTLDSLLLPATLEILAHTATDPRREMWRAIKHKDKVLGKKSLVGERPKGRRFSSISRTRPQLLIRKCARLLVESEQLPN